MQRRGSSRERGNKLLPILSSVRVLSQQLLALLNANVIIPMMCFIDVTQE